MVLNSPLGGAIMILLATAGATPMPVVVVGPGDPNATLDFIFTAVAAGTGVAAAFAGLAAAFYARLTFQIETEKPKLAFASGVVVSAFPGLADAGERQDLEIGIPIQNSGRTTDGLYVDLWILEDPSSPHLEVDSSRNPEWIQGDSEANYVRGNLLTWTRWTRYYRQHVPKGQQIDLEPFTVNMPTIDMNHRVLWRIRSSDGSVFPEDGSRGQVEYTIALMSPSVPSRTLSSS